VKTTTTYALVGGGAIRLGERHLVERLFKAHEKALDHVVGRIVERRLEVVLDETAALFLGEHLVVVLVVLVPHGLERLLVKLGGVNRHLLELSLGRRHGRGVHLVERRLDGVERLSHALGRERLHGLGARSF
jgi:hypothetical protein